MLETPLLNPWKRVAADLLGLKGTNYIVAVDYFSRCVEVKSLTYTTAVNVVAALKSIFSRHGVYPQFDDRQWSAIQKGLTL